MFSFGFGTLFPSKSYYPEKNEIDVNYNDIQIHSPYLNSLCLILPYTHDILP